MSRAVIAWALIGLVLALSFRLAVDHLWVLAVLPIFLWAAAGVGLLLALTWRAFRRTPRAVPVRLGGVILATGILFVPAMSLGGVLTEKIRFAVYRPYYDEVVATVEGRSPDGFAMLRGHIYLVDDGPPVRVAFMWPGGVIDNWCGVVHDPSAEVLKVNDLTDEDAWRRSPITHLFQGDMISCHVLDAPYYLCCFT
jgi:hypothetical protein